MMLTLAAAAEREALERAHAYSAAKALQAQREQARIRSEQERRIVNRGVLAVKRELGMAL